MIFAHCVPQRWARWMGLSLSVVIITASLTIAPSRFIGPPAAAQNGQANGKARKVNPAPPKKGAPAGLNLPNLDEVKRQPQRNPEAQPPIPSSVRRKHKPLRPWSGLKVGDPGTTSRPGVGRNGVSSGSVSERVDPNLLARRSAKPARSAPRKFAHRTNASTRSANAATPTYPSFADNDYVTSFLTNGLGTYQGAELTYWLDILRTAHPLGNEMKVMAARELGDVIFGSAQYAARPNRDCSNSTNAHNYVEDLYRTYLMRGPTEWPDVDASGWDFWSTQCINNGREAVRAGFYYSTEFQDKVAVMYPNGSISSNLGSISGARVDPFNQTGDQLAARDCEWSLPLVSLLGRAGLDLGLGLSYSSLVYTRSGPYLYFDEDRSSVSPGFRLGFASIQGPSFDAVVGKKIYMLVSSSGRRVELRQVSTYVYEAADSSYLQLTDNQNNTLTLRTTDGTQISYSNYANGWQATQVKDRNGNYLTINNDWRGDIQNITDTLGRVFNFNSDGNGNIQSITQYWNSGWHTWATFGWGAALNMSLSGFTGASVVGTFNGEPIPVLRQVGLEDGSYYTFEYTAAGQVNMIRRYTSDNVERSHTSYGYDNDSPNPPTSDCPRITQSTIWGESWTQVTTQFSAASDKSWAMLTSPDGTIYKQLFATTIWQRGLPTESKVYLTAAAENSDNWEKHTTTIWDHDGGASAAYPTNPRVTNTYIDDASGNHWHSKVMYTSFSLPSDVYEYDSNTSTILRRTHTDYNLTGTYTDKRIIGLPSAQYLCDGAQGETPCNDYSGSSLLSKVALQYDEAGSVQYQSSPTQHDDTNYGSAFLQGRGNLSGTRRYDVINVGQSTLSSVQYNTAGSVITASDAMNHVSSISYSASYAYAYPTTLTDGDGYSSYVQYNFDFGAKTQVQGPPPAGQSVGAIQTTTYDNARRVDRVTTINTGAYTRYVYGPYWMQTWSAVNNVADEAYTLQTFDGLGRVMGVAGYHPGSSSGYKGQMIQYDLMGRPFKQYNPTEMTPSWQAYGDDAAGWYFTQQTYDWKGRPLVTTNQDGTQKYASYSGCGCAGGEVVTLTDEMGRQQRVYSDVLGRTWKTETLNDQGGVYSSTTSSFNARDQVTAVNTYKGTATFDLSCPSGTCMQSATTYDGYGRAATHKLPQQNNPASYAYNPDDTVLSVTDPRGVIATNTYNYRHLLTGVSYTPAGGVPALASVSFGYDAAGNRISMSDGSGTASYGYDQLSRMTSETKIFSGLSNSYTINYGYNLSGLLTSVTDPSGAQVSYGYDSIGRLGSMTGSGYPGVTNFLSSLQYRATGAMKHATYGNSAQLNLSYNTRMQIGQYQVTGLYAWQGGPAVTMGAMMSYYNDGRTNTAFDLNDTRFDRKYEFDFSARLKEAYSGVEAHGAPAPPLNQANSPYRQSYTYDEWNNVSSRTGRIWTQGDPFSTYYYSDAAGNILGTNDGQYTYDAADRPNTFTSQQNWQQYPNWPSWGGPDGPALETQDTFDGSGQVVRHINHTRTDLSSIQSFDPETGEPYITYWRDDSTTTTYYVHSTVLGGKTIEELDQNGNKLNGYVYAGNARIATHAVQAWGSPVSIECTNPVTGASFTTDPNGISVSVQQPDPLGRDLTNPPDPMAIVDPIASTKLQSPMYIEYTANWTGELESGMAQYEGYVAAATARYIYNATKREFLHALFDLARTGDNKYFDKMQTILTKNPNFMISIDGEWTAGRDAANALVGAMAKLPGDPLGLNASAQERPSMQRPGYNGKQNGLEWTRDEKGKLDRAVDIALKLLQSNSECELLLRGASNNAYDVLKGMSGRSASFLNRSQTRPIRNGWETIAWTRTTMGIPLMQPQVDLYAGFFDDTRQFGMGFDQTRALTILHELGHVTYQYFHSSMASVVGAQNLSDEQVDQLIYRTCFSTPLPRGISE